MNLEEPAVAAMPQPLANDQQAQAPAEAHAAAPPRRRRPEPLRIAPHRHAATLLRDAAPAACLPAPAAGAGSAGSAAAARAPAAAGAGESPVSLGVRLGYQVIEEQILQGQKLAQRLGRKAARAVGAGAGRGAAEGAASAAGGAAEGAADPARGDTPNGAGDVGELLGRVVHLYKDLGALCVDAVEALARNPVLRAGVARLTPTAALTAAAPTAAAPSAAAALPEPEGAARGAGGGFALDIRCSRRTQVTLDLRWRGGVGAPRVHALHAADPALPPLTDVRFTIDAAQPEPVLQLVIADEHPAATYTGVVVDGSTNEPRGTLSVRLLP